MLHIFIFNFFGYLIFVSSSKPNIFSSLFPIPNNSPFSLSNKVESQLPVAKLMNLFVVSESLFLFILVSSVKVALGVELNPPPLLHPQAYIFLSSSHKAKQ